MRLPHQPTQFLDKRVPLLIDQQMPLVERLCYFQLQLDLQLEHALS
jgi:hypothetical protein